MLTFVLGGRHVQGARGNAPKHVIVTTPSPTPTAQPPSTRQPTTPNKTTPASFRLPSPKPKVSAGTGEWVGVMEFSLLALNLMNLLTQSYALYRTHFRYYDVDLLVIAAVTLARYTIQRHILDQAVTSRKKIGLYLSSQPRAAASIVTAIGLSLLSIARITWADPLRTALCLAPYFASTILFGRPQGVLPEAVTGDGSGFPSATSSSSR